MSILSWLFFMMPVRLRQVLSPNPILRKVGYYNTFMDARHRKMSPKSELRLVSAIWEALRLRPNDWIMDEHTIADRVTGTQLWTSNGIEFLAIYDSSRVPLIALRCGSQTVLWREIRRIHRRGAVKVYTANGDDVASRMSEANAKIEP